LGAAYLAGLAVGFWGSKEEIARQWRVDRRFDPRMPRARAEESRALWREAVSRSKGWVASGEGS
jgi:glycerol kinase